MASVIKKSLLATNRVPIAPGITLRLPKVGEVLDRESGYYSLAQGLTSTPYQYMVQLDDRGIDFTTISEWDLFRLIFCDYANAVKKIKSQQELLSTQVVVSASQEEKRAEALALLSEQMSGLGLDLVFEGLDIAGYAEYESEEKGEILYNPNTGVVIDIPLWRLIVQGIRMINCFDYCKLHVKKDEDYKSGSHTREYLLQKERAHQKYLKRKGYQPYLETMIFAATADPGCKYDIAGCKSLTIYEFTKTVKQIQHRVGFDNSMLGVYTGNLKYSSVPPEFKSWAGQS